MKKCTKCNEIKPKSEFGNHKLTKDKLQCHCKECINLNSKKHKENNPEWSRNHYLSKQEYYKKLTLDRYKDNRDFILTKQKEWAEKNKEHIKAYQKEWSLKNKDKINNYHKERKENNPNIRLACILRSKISTNIRRVGSIKDQKSLDIVGLNSWDCFRKYIETKFENGMNWDNYGIGQNNTTWHIDHIIPISSASTLEEVKKLNHYSNLRPMWGSDNIRKSNKMLGD
jgi:hypothetical protein